VHARSHEKLLIWLGAWNQSHRLGFWVLSNTCILCRQTRHIRRSISCNLGAGTCNDWPRRPFGPPIVGVSAAIYRLSSFGWWGFWDLLEYRNAILHDNSMISIRIFTDRRIKLNQCAKRLARLCLIFLMTASHLRVVLICLLPVLGSLTSLVTYRHDCRPFEKLRIAWIEPANQSWTQAERLAWAGRPRIGPVFAAWSTHESPWDQNMSIFDRQVAIGGIGWVKGQGSSIGRWGQ